MIPLITKTEDPMDLTTTKLTEIYVLADDFCQNLSAVMAPYMLVDDTRKKRRNKPCKLSDAEVITIMLAFHLGGYRCLKHFYLFHVCKHLRGEFPKTVSYNRFTELGQKAALPLAMFLKVMCKGYCTGVTFVDSTPVKVCHNKRIRQHKVFRGIAERGRSSTGWFYGFKLHFTINDRGEVLSFAVTQGNTDDRNDDVMRILMKDIFGKLVADKGYLSKKLFESLFEDGIHLITKIRSNMKNQLMDLGDKILLRKRAVIESVVDELKSICQIEHTRHRSPLGFLVNLLAGIAAYHFLPKKPSLKIVVDESDQLTLW